MKIRNLLIIISLLFSACNNRQEGTVSQEKPGKEEMADLNRYLVQKDKERILNYAERKNLRLSESSTGLWYQIIDEGREGSHFSDDDRIIFDYECSLLDGTECYSSETLGPKEIILGRSNIESGLNEGLRMLRPGSEAIFILPPFLAYGLVGDGKSIPPRTVIVYRIKITEQ